MREIGSKATGLFQRSSGIFATLLITQKQKECCEHISDLLIQDITLICITQEIPQKHYDKDLLKYINLLSEKLVVSGEVKQFLSDISAQVKYDDFDDNKLAEIQQIVDATMESVAVEINKSLKSQNRSL